MPTIEEVTAEANSIIGVMQEQLAELTGKFINAAAENRRLKVKIAKLEAPVEASEPKPAEPPAE